MTSDPAALHSGTAPVPVRPDTVFLPVRPGTARLLAGPNTVFLSADPNSLFDPDSGIYMEGNFAQAKEPHYGANYWLDKENINYALRTMEEKILV